MGNSVHRRGRVLRIVIGGAALAGVASFGLAGRAEAKPDLRYIGDILGHPQYYDAHQCGNLAQTGLSPDDGPITDVVHHLETVVPSFENGLHTLNCYLANVEGSLLGG